MQEIELVEESTLEIDLRSIKKLLSQGYRIIRCDKASYMDREILIYVLEDK